MTTVAVVMTVDAKADLNVIEAECQRAGLMGINLLPRLGLVTGVIDDSSLSELEKIPGVRAVELERKISVWPPP